MKIPPPTYHVGDTVYMIEQNKIVEKTITGVIALSDYDEKKFDTYRYYLETRKSIESYGWTKESDLHISRAVLLGTL